jgi:hypothetical protein
MSAELWQIWYQDSQKVECFPFANLYFNEKLTIFFENDPIVRLVTTTKAEKIAVCSWKLRQKMRLRVGKRGKLTEEALNSNYEVLSFTSNTKYHRMLAAAEAWHPGFKPAMQKICDQIGVTLPGEVRSPIYQNHFSARADIYLDYVNTYLQPAMEAMIWFSDLHQIVMQDSHYSELSNQNPDHLKDKIGVPYYPLAPFLLERLFSIYCHNKKINVTYL